MGNVRDESLQTFLDAASVAYATFAAKGEASESVGHIFRALETPGTQRTGPGNRPTVAAENLDRALEVSVADPILATLIESFSAIRPRLEWRQRPDHTNTASENFAEGHANTMIAGPGGLEDRDDVWLGVSLMAPHVRYPDHDHPPEEVYLVMSDGEFRQADGDWFSPGVGGSFYNPPGIKHAMRSLNTPLFAFWALRPEGKS